MHNTLTQYNYQSISDSMEIENLRAALFQNYWFSKSEVTKMLEKVIFENDNPEGVILCLQKNQCLQCVKSILRDFEILQQDTQFRHFYIIGDFDRKEDFDSYIEKLNTDLIFTKIQYKFDFPTKSEYPLVFILDNSHYPKYFFVPALFPKYREEYFYNTILKYIEKTVE